MRRGLFACAAIVAVQTAWAVVPTDYPAQFEVTERHRLTFTGYAQGRTATQTRRFRRAGIVLLQDAATIFVSGVDAENGLSECVCTHTAKSSLRFDLTEAAKYDFEAAFQDMIDEIGLPGTTTIRFGRGRLAFSRSGERVHGREVIRMTLRGRYRGIPFRVTGPWAITWRGARV